MQQHNGKPMTLSTPDLIVSSDASLEGWGAACKGERAGGKFTWEEKQKLTHINELEISAALKTIQTFYRIHKPRTMHLKIDNLTALSYIIKMGGKSNQKMNQISKQIWEFMMKNKCQLTAEYIPSKLNIEADQESRAKDCSEWKLNPQIFQTICNKMGKPEIDLFASLATHQLTKYMSWKPDPKAIAVNALQTSWTHTFPYAFPPFKLIGKTLNKIRYHHISAIIVTPLWPSAPWYPMLIQMAIKDPLFPTNNTKISAPVLQCTNVQLPRESPATSWISSTGWKTSRSSSRSTNGQNTGHGQKNSTHACFWIGAQLVSRILCPNV